MNRTYLIQGDTASVRVKFRPSTVADKEGTIYYQVIRLRVIRQIKTNYHIFSEEWDAKKARVVLGGDRAAYLLDIQRNIQRDVKRIGIVIVNLKNCDYGFTADDIVEKYAEKAMEQSFCLFMQNVIVRLRQQNQGRTAENYMAALNSFMRFRKGEDTLVDDICGGMMMEYEAYLKESHIAMNTISFYMRILRAAYNRAVERGLTEQSYPFRHVYTGVDRTVKRAIPAEAIRLIKELDLSAKPSTDFARDMFLFSFYTRGMSFVDMAYLRKQDLQNGILSYRRHKTGQQLFVKWEKCMQSIIDKYPRGETEHLLPIIRTAGDEQRQYRNAMRLVNKKLKKISAMLGLPRNLTMYVSRHSWASIAKSKDIPLSVISESMGHNSEATTQIYLMSLDSSRIDQANELILETL